MLNMTHGGICADQTNQLLLDAWVPLLLEVPHVSPLCGENPWSSYNGWVQRWQCSCVVPFLKASLLEHLFCYLRLSSLMVDVVCCIYSVGHFSFSFATIWLCALDVLSSFWVSFVQRLGVIDIFSILIYSFYHILFGLQGSFRLLFCVFFCLGIVSNCCVCVRACVCMCLRYN